MDGLLLFMMIGLPVIGNLLGLLVGKRSGRREERERCERICVASFQEKKLSPTARRIYHSISGGHERLVTEDEFWPTERSMGEGES